MKLYQRPYNFLRDKWKTFKSYSLKKKLLIIGGTTTVILIVIPLLSYAYFVRDINDRERLMNRKSTGIVITDRNDKEIYSYGRTSSGEFYTLDQISDDLEQALISSEDKEFYEHKGVSIRGIAGAVIANVLNRDVSKYGGSTITQQLVKNTLLTNDKNFLRKYQEMSMAFAIEREYTKNEILEMYLNSVYFGEGAFGIEQAAKIYFNKTPQELNLAESSILVGLLPAPSVYSPVSGDVDLAKQEQERVLNQMVTDGHITDEEKKKIFKQKLTYAETDTEEREYAHHFSQMILSDLNERYGEEKVTRSGFKVKSSLDLEAQKNAEQVVKDQIDNLKSLGANNAALVAIDPKTGEIKALVGSIDWQNKEFGQVNMALMPRQPGSSFKPIYYSEALDKKIITPATILKDEPRTFSDGYEPQNYDFAYRGDITARHALAISLNIPAIEVMEKLGVNESVAAAERMGIDTLTEPEKYGLTLALGTAETELIDMVNAYSAFANYGSQYEPTMILTIADKYGKTIYIDQTEEKEVISPEASFLMSSILSDEDARAPLSGSSLNLPGRDVAVKTGTTSDNVDAWTIGYTPSLAVGVWVGDNTHKPMQVGGTAAAGPIWRSTMENILGDSPAEEFEPTDNIVRQELCSVNGTYYEFYIEGTEPSDHCYIPTQAEIDAMKKREQEKKEEEQREREQREREEEEEESNSETNTDTEDTATEEPASDGDSTTDETTTDGETTDGSTTDGSDSNTDGGDSTTNDGSTTTQ